MAHGAPDFWRFAARGPIYPVFDLAELAVRLGSVVSYDRRGDVLWFDDFESTTLKWNVQLSGTGAAMARSTAYARNGDASLLVTCPSDSDFDVPIRHPFPLPPLASRLGLEVSFFFDEDMTSIEFRLDGYTGSSYFRGAIRWHYVDQELSYWDGSSWVSLLTSFGLAPETYLFQTAKLVIDVDAERYVRCLVNSTEVDLSAHALSLSSSATNYHGRAFLDVVGSSGTNSKLYLDDVIVTQNEP